MSRSEIVWKIVNLLNDLDDDEFLKIAEQVLKSKITQHESGMGDYFTVESEKSDEPDER